MPTTKMPTIEACRPKYNCMTSCRHWCQGFCQGPKVCSECGEKVCTEMAYQDESGKVTCDACAYNM